MSRYSRVSSVAILAAMTAAAGSAQSVTSAHSGTLHYFDGDVSIDGTPVESRVGRFSEIKEQSVLRTAQGRAEVLLTPGVFLRVGENSAVKMLDNRLLSTRVEILSGTAVVESDDPQMSIRDSPVSLIYKDYEIRLVKHGLVEIGSDPAQLKVYKGEAIVNFANGNAANGTTANDRATVKEGRLLPFSAALVTEALNDKVGDDLYMWARDRSQSVSSANMSSARSLNSTGYGSGSGYLNILDSSGYGSGQGGWNGGWYFNPYFNMFTFVPSAGTSWNAFGYGFFSPNTIYDYYSPSNYWYGGGGARGTGSIGRPLSGIANPSNTEAGRLSSLLPKNPGSVAAPSRDGSAVGSGTASLAHSGIGGGGFSSSGLGHSSSVGGHGGGRR